MTDEFDARKYLLDELDRNFRESVANRNFLWDNYWEGRRMVTVPDPSVKEGDAHHVVSERERGCSGPADLTRPGDEPGRRLFASFPNLAPKGEPIMGTSFLDTPTHHAQATELNNELSRRVDAMVARKPPQWVPTIRDCIARLKSARAKESTNRNLSTLLAVVVKVQKDLETLVGEETVAHDPEV